MPPPSSLSRLMPPPTTNNDNNNQKIEALKKRLEQQGGTGLTGQDRRAGTATGGGKASRYAYGPPNDGGELDSFRRAVPRVKESRAHVGGGGWVCVCVHACGVGSGGGGYAYGPLNDGGEYVCALPCLCVFLVVVGGWG